MSARTLAGQRRGSRHHYWIAVLCASLLAAADAPTQEPRPSAAVLPQTPALSVQPAPAQTMAQPEPDSKVEQASCRSCGSGGHGGSHGFAGGCASGTCGANCYPGRFCDHECGTHSNNVIARMWQGCYECLCCPDPCYEPRWIAAANAAFWVDQVRPKTQMRFRWDAWRNGEFLDRSEFIHARGGAGGGKGPRIQAARYDLDQFSLYTEGATDRFGLFLEMPYRNLDPENRAQFEAGFGDLVIGTKSLLLDCELMQITFQFQTFIPTGQASKGLGTGHTALEPSLLMALKLAPHTYFQGQAAYRIPIAGDQDYAGDVFHYHLSLNHVLWRPLTGVQIIGTAELNGWSILDGAYTFPLGAEGLQVDARGTILSAGPGLRVVICDKIDFGVGTAFAATADKWAEQMYRAEFRWRF